MCTYLSLVQFVGSELHCVVCDCSSDKCTIQGNTYSTKSGSAGFKTTYTLTILSVCVEYCLDPDAFSNSIYKTLRNGLRRRFTSCVHHFIVCEISLRSLRLGTVFNCLYNLKDMQFTFVITFLVNQDVMFDLQGLHTALPEIPCVVGNPF